MDSIVSKDGAKFGLCYSIVKNQVVQDIKITCLHYFFFHSHSIGIQCPDPGIPDNGRRILNDFRAGMLVFFVCDDGYQINGEQHLQCLKNGTWNGDTPTCQLVDSKFLHYTTVLC